MMRLAALITLLAGMLALATAPANGTPPFAQQPAGAAAAETKKCVWVWKKKKVVRWVKRHGKPKRVVRYRKVKVRVCRNMPVPAPSRLGVKAWEFGFTLSAKRIEAGDTIVELNNQGEDAHDLHIQRVAGGAELSTPETEPGDQQRIRFNTVPGEYRLWCSLPNHAAWGMDTNFEAG